MAKKPIRPLRSEIDYDVALKEIERYFEKAPARGTPEADRFDLLAIIIEDPSPRLISGDCSARVNAPRTS